MAFVLVALVGAGNAGATPPPPGYDIYATGIDMDPWSPAPNTVMSIGGGSAGIDAGDLQLVTGNIPLGDVSSPTGVGHVCVDVVVDSVPNGGTPSGGSGIFGVGMVLHWDGAIAGLVGYRAGSKHVGRTEECITDAGSGPPVLDPNDFLHSFGVLIQDTFIIETNDEPNPIDTAPVTSGAFRIDNFWSDWTETGPGRVAQFNLRCLTSGSTALTIDDPPPFGTGGNATAGIKFASGEGGTYSVSTEFEAMLYCDTNPPNDGDGDGVPDESDNCPSVVNPGQEDTDGDQVGDVCDNCLTTPNPSQVNNDSDTFGDACDNCPTHINQDQMNDDADASGDICEPLHCRGVPNWWASPSGAADPDCDGFSTTIETDPDIGTDPNDACANTPGANDENPDDKWPADFTDNQVVNTLDLTGYASRLGTIPATALDRRHDLNQNGVINTLDLVIYASAINRSCVPPP